MRRTLIAIAIVALGFAAWATGFKPQAQAETQAQATSKSVGLSSQLGLSAAGVDAITIPHMLNYQGKLLNASGNPVPDTTYSVVFGLYSQASGGTAFWTETQTVRTKAGLFSVLLGLVTPIVSVPDAGTLYLGMKVGVDPEMTPRVQIASAAYAYIAHKADTANYAIAGGSGGDNAWVHGGDSVLYTIRQLGVARGGAGNVLHGTHRYTHTNLGSSSTTGASGRNNDYCTVAGGFGNTASDSCATVGGGYENAAGDTFATVGGGCMDTASGGYSIVSGGYQNRACSSFATVSGGWGNTASGQSASVGGGLGNTASGMNATVSGGYDNGAGSEYASIGGGSYNTATGQFATVGGGYQNTADGDYSFVVGQGSWVPTGWSNSAAFNGTTANAGSQTSVGTLKHNFAVFSMDHPLDPDGRILNQYVTGSDEPLMTYRGTATIGSGGQVTVQLPDYFDALCRNPMIQLTGVGSADVVYVAQDVSANRFVIGGKPGMKVYWTVTGERKDQAAEIGRLQMPVEQPKTGALAGRSLDDDYLVGCMQQLEKMGKAGEFSFRTAAGKQRYEDMLKQLQEAKQHKEVRPVQPRVEVKQPEPRPQLQKLQR